VAQKTFADGDVLTASDLNTYASHEGGAWTAFTPVITQSGGVTCTVTYGKYARAGRLITFNFYLTVTGSGTSSNPVTVSLPVTAAATNGVNGAGWIYDESVTTRYSGVWTGSSTSVVALVHDASGANTWGNAPTTALASGDLVVGSIIYEAAS